MELIPYILTVSLSSGVISQTIKFALKVAKQKTFNWHQLDAYGGMPSSHSAFLFALCTAVGMYDGFYSSTFAITFVLSAIIIRDAFGLRMIMEEQGKVVVQITRALPKKIDFNEHDDNNQIGHRVGHTIPEIIVGALIGITVAISGYFVLL